MATKGYAAPEVGKAYARALDLCQQIGDSSELLPVLFGLSTFNLVRAEYRIARRLGEQLLGHVENAPDPGPLVEAHFAFGIPSFFLGELAIARKQLDQAIALYDAERRHPHALIFGQDRGVMPRVFNALTLWHLGYPDQALKRSEEALALARVGAHPFILAYAQSFNGLVRNLRREWLLAEEHAGAAIALSSDKGFELFLRDATIFRGWAQAGQGGLKEGIAEMRDGLAARSDLAVECFRPCLLSQLAAACGKLGRSDDALALVAESLAPVERREERHWEAEIYRLKGELLLDSGSSSEAETCFRHAVDIAHGQSAKSLELRAVTSLSRLLQKRGKKEEARQMLAEIYGWFSEGFETADLKEAKALLDELS